MVPDSDADAVSAAADLDAVERIRLQAAGVAHPFKEVLDELDDDSWLAERIAAAEDPDSPPDVLAALAGDAHPDVLTAVAGNESVPAEILDGLAVAAAGELGWLIRYTVAVHPNTSADTLARLTGDPDPHVREAALDNPRCRPLTPSERARAGLLKD